MKFNFRVISTIIGVLLLLNGLFVLSCLPIALYYHEDTSFSIILSAGIILSVGIAAWLFGNGSRDKELKKRDGYLIVTLGWLSMSFFGAIPFVISGAIPNYTDAFFETISGFTTTGASILNNIEAMPKSLLFWRSLTQWIGGMGIIVLAIAILPILGIGGMQLFVAEAPGITPDKLHPRIKSTAIRLWSIYVGLTLLEMVLLKFGGMSFFDALNHSLTTMATGGFSTRQDSIAFYHSPFIQYVIIFFMFLAGTNFTLIYFGLHFQFGKVFRNEEFRSYIIWMALITVFTTITLIGLNYNGEEAFRTGLFQVVSIMTTTGFATADYTVWGGFMLVLFFMMMFFGASAGSTSGGVKIVRYLVLVKNSVLELKRQLHPSAVIPLRINGKAVSEGVTNNVLAFIMIYIMLFALGSVVMSATGLDFETSIGATITSLSNIGPGIGTVGPAGNFAHISDFGKWFLAALMLIGRLEIFTVLILFSPFFWRRY